MNERVAVVIPSYRVASTILRVIRDVPDWVERIYVVDDACPENTGDLVEREVDDRRVTVLRHERNRGVGGAVITGYLAAWREGLEVAVKVDGDGQMDPSIMARFVEPIVQRQADYTKGNRFFLLESLHGMPAARLLGNAALSLVSKVTTGYWNVMDPTNGYTALHLRLVPHLQLEKVHRRFFFESDMLFRLGLVRAAVGEIPINARYSGERSNLRIRSVLGTFAWRHAVNLFKRVFYVYFLRDFSPGTVYLLLGAPLTIAGAAFGLIQWRVAESQGAYASSGTVMLAALPILIGAQLLISGLNWDIQSVPRQPIWPHLEDDRG